MSRQKYFIGKRTKVLFCPCGYNINSISERERELKIRLHSRNCDIAANANYFKGPDIFPKVSITPLNVAIHRNNEKINK